MLDRLANALSSNIDEHNLPVRAEQIRARLHSYPLMMGGQLLIAPLLVSLMWDKVAHQVLLVWVGVLFAALSLEVFYVWRDAAATNSLAECRLWRTRLMVFVFMIGVIWGAGGVLLFVVDDLAYQALLICVFLGVAAGAATTNPVFPPALYIYISLLILPLFLINAVVGDHTHTILAGMLVVYWGYVLKTGRDLAATFELSLRRTFENENLVRQLTEEKQHAEQANLTKSRFLAAASHDLRQPMYALALFVDLLKGHVQGEQGVELHGKVGHSVEVLSGMFDALLDVSKLDAGVVQPACRVFPIQQLLDRLRDEFVLLAQQKDLQLEMSASAARVYSDPLLLECVLRNLLSNAIHHTERGSISLLSRNIEDGLELTVLDTGIGISAEDLPYIFEEYYQVGSQHRDRRNGLGLGLAIVKRLDQLLDLHLQVTSTPDEGTRFVMRVLDQNAVAEVHGA